MLHPDSPRSIAALAQAPDSELVTLAAGGDTAAFENIMRRHNRLLYRTARSILWDDVEAEDVLQEAYFRAWKSLSTFRAEARLSTWLTRIVINEALGRLRKRSGKVIPMDATIALDEVGDVEPGDDAERGPELTAMRDELRSLIEKRIDLLPDAFRTVFVLRAIEELTVEETAAALDIPEATVRSRFFRARGLLREGLSREFDFAVNDAFSFDGARCDRIVARVQARISEAGNIALSTQEVATPTIGLT